MRNLLRIGTFFVLSATLPGFSLRAQQITTSTGLVQKASADNLAAMLVAVEATDPLPAAAAPAAGNFYSAAHLNWPPMPGNVNQLPVWPLGGNCYLVDDRDFSEAASGMGMRWLSLATESFESLNGPEVSAPVYGSNDLWLEITGFSGGQVNLSLHNPTNEIYAIWNTTNLLVGWDVAVEVWPTNAEVMPFTVPTLGRADLFLRAQDWTEVDSNSDGIPDWWIWKYFGDLSETATNLDSQGRTLLYDYQNGLDPNAIQFTVRLGNRHYNTTTATGNYLVVAGTPAYEAVLLANTNFDNAVWQPYDGVVHMDLGATDGVYRVWMGLKGRADDSQATWIGTEVTLTRTLPQITITSPTNAVVAQPYLQLQGYSAMPLGRVACDFNGVTNKPGFIIGHTLDTNTLSYTRDYFQCYDLLLTNGVNSITLHATDPAGNTFTTNLAVTLDYSSATNPVIEIIWPQDGMQICGSSLTLRGWTEDAAAKVAAMITDVSGNTNVVAGVVERDGKLWVEGLPLGVGTNQVILWVTNAAGLLSVTNLSVVKSDMTFALTSVSGDLWLPTVNVSGTISDPTAAVWVNGVEGTNNGDGTWR
jgi:hypothetical protein